MHDNQQVMLVGSEVEPLAEYRAISRAATVAFALGLASIVAWAHPISWIVPMSGVVAAMWALRVTASPSTVFGGRRLAFAGLFLSLFFGLSALGQWWTERQLVYHHGRKFADRFVELLQEDDWVRATECTESFLYRQPDSVPLNEFYEEDEAAGKALQRFKERPAASAIQARAPASQIEFERRAGYGEQGYRRSCRLVYRFTDSSGRPQFVNVEITRDADPETTKEPHWRVTDLHLLEP